MRAPAHLKLHWFTTNYLQVDATKTTGMTQGSQYPYNILIGDKCTEIERILNILDVTLDRDLSFGPHVAIMLIKDKIAVLRRMKRFIP